MTAAPSDLMRAAVYVGDGRIVVEEVPVPEPRPGRAAGGGGRVRDLRLRPPPGPRPVRHDGAILGHEWSGIVVGGRRGRAGRAAGERVVFTPTPGCGVCRPCRRGRPSVCLRRPVRRTCATCGAPSPGM